MGYKARTEEVNIRWRGRGNWAVDVVGLVAEVFDVSVDSEEGFSQS